MLLALPWLLSFLAFIRLGNRRPDLRDAPPVTGPRVSVIIPARNEAGSIETVTRSVLASTYPQLEVIVVDDGSTDDTPAQVERLALADARLRLVRGEELPAGWYGKPWACYQGYRAAGGDILVFTDADTRHDPSLLAHAVGALEAERADLVTIAPLQRCVSFWERVIMPQIWLLLGMRFQPRAVNRARRARDVIANGQFVCLRRASYELIGTHEAVRAEVAEDLALAQRIWQAGMRLHFAFAESLMETRMYTGFGHLVEGWSKNLFLGGRRSYPDSPLRRSLVPVTLAVAMLYWLVPAVLLLPGAAGVLTPALWTATKIAVGASMAFWMLISAGMRIPFWYGALYPLGAGAALYIILRSTARGRGRVEWRGRVYGAEVNTAP